MRRLVLCGGLLEHHFQHLRGRGLHYSSLRALQFFSKLTDFDSSHAGMICAMLDPPMGAIYMRAVFLAQRSGLSEVGVDQFLAALSLPEIDSFLSDFDPSLDEKLPIRPGTFPLSDELWKALTTAGWQILGETITWNMVREALVASRKNRE